MASADPVRDIAIRAEESAKQSHHRIGELHDDLIRVKEAVDALPDKVLVVVTGSLETFSTTFSTEIKRLAIDQAKMQVTCEDRHKPAPPSHSADKTAVKVAWIQRSQNIWVAIIGALGGGAAVVWVLTRIFG